MSLKTLMFTGVLCKKGAKEEQRTVVCFSFLTWHMFILQQDLLLGAVGAFDGSGGVLRYEPVTKTAVFLNESKDEVKGAQYSYLGKY